MMNAVDRIIRGAGPSMAFAGAFAGSQAFAAAPAPKLVSYQGSPMRIDTAGDNRAGGIHTQDGGYTYMSGDTMRNFVGEILSGANCPSDGRQAYAAQQGSPPGFAQRQPAGQTVAYSPFEPTGARRFPIGGFRRTVTALLPSQTVTNTPQLPFRGERLVVPSNIAVDFDIVDLKVGQASEFVAVGTVPALVFSEQGFEVTLRGDTAYVGNTISISVANLAAVDKDFAAAIIGTTIRGNLAPRTERDEQKGL